jgi:hypothetical protein
MPKTLDTASAVDFAVSAIGMLGGPDAAEQLARPVEKFFESARQASSAAASAASGGKAVPAITWVRVVVYDADASGDEEPVQVEYSSRTIIDARPVHKRMLVASGGGHTSCETVRNGTLTVHICTESTY